MSKVLSFEQAMDELSTIVNALEKGDIALDDAMKHYEKAIELHQYCAKILQDAELKIKELDKKTVQQLQQHNSDEATGAF